MAGLPDQKHVDRLDRQGIALALADVASQAGAAIMQVYAEPIDVRTKADLSPVSAADEAAEVIIIAAVRRLLPDWCILAEEACAQYGLPEVHRRMVAIDPLDGTKEFIARRDEFTVNIALVEDGLPIAGVVYAPALNRMYLAGDGAWAGEVVPGAKLDAAALRPLHCRAYPQEGLVVVMSRSHADAQTLLFIEGLTVTDTVSAGSSLKFCLVAEGRADVYPRFGPTMEWDTAAGQAVVEAAGGQVLTPEGARFRYGKTDAGYRNGPFIVWGGRALA